jgi:hypothetical protein
MTRRQSQGPSARRNRSTNRTVQHKNANSRTERLIRIYTRPQIQMKSDVCTDRLRNPKSLVTSQHAQAGMLASSHSPITSGPSQCALVNFAVSCEIIRCPQQDPAHNSTTSNTVHISTSFRAIKPTIRADTNPIFS